jgi:fructose-specific phosphotransferase system IIC component
MNFKLILKTLTGVLQFFNVVESKKLGELATTAKPLQDSATIRGAVLVLLGLIVGLILAYVDGDPIDEKEWVFIIATIIGVAKVVYSRVNASDKVAFTFKRRKLP